MKWMERRRERERQRAQDARLVEWARTHRLVVHDEYGNKLVDQHISMIQIAMRWGQTGEIIPRSASVYVSIVRDTSPLVRVAMGK
ncbi:hypothetical protein [Streptomyces sp. ISL-100]|uniref:hypothetical protein n=1 Tax=Streptomyces sp. ISL-100 TaxID=2819173 RepID=UPI001BE652D8|nr:hypothetical protein [Streptomyces sp. ISL-100]MBT2400650.1 hypothetical protein [Streptomyces sp. ISL-100]